MKKCEVDFKIFNERPKFWQWDIGQKLICDGMTPGMQVHFSNDGQSTRVQKAYTYDGKTVVDVPDVLLQSCHDIYVYAYVTDKGGSYTSLRMGFSVNKRPKPSNYGLVDNTNAMLGTAILGQMILGIGG